MPGFLLRPGSSFAGGVCAGAKFMVTPALGSTGTEDAAGAGAGAGEPAGAGAGAIARGAAVAAVAGTV